MPVPTWLTGWVKMNTKHVVFQHDGRDTMEKKQRKARSQTTGLSYSIDLEMEASLRDPDIKRSPIHGRRLRRRSLQRNQTDDDLKERDHEEGAVLEKVVDFSRSFSPRAVADSKHGDTLQAEESDDGDISSHSRRRRSVPRCITTVTSLPSPERGGFYILAHPFILGGQLEPQPCPLCVEMDAKLMAALDDLEYMRDVALKAQSDAASSKCKPQNVGKPLLLGAGARVDSSKQLNEVVARHQKQVEQLTKERLRWQQEMHLKLNKFANLCKNLNEESAVLNSKCTSLREELEQAQSERNTASEELMLLRAQVEQHKREKAQFEACQAKLAELEMRDLKSQTAIQSRDAMIDELSTKLEKTLDQLEMERAQRQARRNVIFPKAALA